MIQVALFQPEIPPNTGNIIRLCANTGAKLHLIHPLGFLLNDKSLKRAGLDYHYLASIIEHKAYALFLKSIASCRLVACSTRGTVRYSDFKFLENDILLFGSETRGLPAEILKKIEPSNLLRIPMRPESRSLNLSNAVAIIVYEAWKQFNYAFKT